MSIVERRGICEEIAAIAPIMHEMIGIPANRVGFLPYGQLYNNFSSNTRGLVYEFLFFNG